MNAPFVVAQAVTSGQGITTGQTPATPPTIVKLVKPQGDQAIVVNMDGNTRLDFSGIAGEKITLVHVGERLVILFDNKSTVTIDPFFDSSGKPLQLGGIDLDGNRIVSADEFAALFPITEDQSILPAAGDGNTAGPQNTGGQFGSFIIQDLLAGDPLALLPQEELGNFVTEVDTNPLLDDEPVDLLPTQTGATVNGVVEEEQFLGNEQHSLAGTGNEDNDDIEGLDTDEDPANQITLTVSGTLAPLGAGGNPPLSFSIYDVTSDANDDNDFVRDTTGVIVKSLGDPVKFVFVDSTAVQGWTDDNRLVFTLVVNPDGTYDFALNDQLDHPTLDGLVGDNLENSLNLNLTSVVQITDNDGDPLVLTGNAFTVTVVDDIPVVFKEEPLKLRVDEDDIRNFQSLGSEPNDGNYPDGSFTGNPAGNNFGPAFTSGSLLGTVVLVGADANENREANFSFVTGADSKLDSLGLTSKGQEIQYRVEGDHEFIAYVDNGQPGPSGADRVVFKFTLQDNGEFTFELFDQLDHDRPFDDFGDFPGGPGDQWPLSDQNSDLRDTLQGEDVSWIDFGQLIQVTDFDGDSVPLDEALLIKIRDDVPEIRCGREICLTVNEDDIRTDQSLGTSPNDGPHDGSFTGNPFSPFGHGPAVVFGSLGGPNGVVQAGADERLTFSFINENLVKLGLGFLGLSSKGHELSYDIHDGVLYAFDNAGNSIGQTYDPQADRLVFQLTLESDGDFKFELYDQIDHDEPNHGADQNYDLQDDLPFGLDVSAIDFGQFIKATDYDGDSVILADQLEIKIKDDVPEVKCGEGICLTVDEDDIQTNRSEGTSPDDGNYPDGSFTGDSGQDNGGPATVSGTLSHLVTTGADEKLTFTFTGNAEDKLDDLGLSSKGHDVKYDVQGNTLYAYVGNGGFGQGDRLVFKLTLDSDGSFKFQLYDQLDHDEPNHGADQNFDLQDDVWYGDVSSIDFGRIIKATDFDGDSVILKDQLEIRIRDDSPEVKCGEKVFGVVEEEHLHKGNEDFDANPDLDQDHQQQGSDYNDTTTVASGNSQNGNSLLSLVNVGADEKGTFTFRSSVDVCDTIKDKDGCVVTSGGKTVEITNIEHGDNQNGDYTRITAGTTGQNGNTVFILTVWENGDWKFELKDQIDHHAPEDADNQEGLLFLDFSSLVEFTDFDGDSICLEDCSFIVKVIDDVPVAEIHIVPLAIVQHDETADPQFSPLNFFDPDLDTTHPAIVALFSAVPDKGDDPDVAPGSKVDGAIGFAASLLPIVTGLGSSAGADSPATHAFSLMINGDQASGLTLTDGVSTITLVQNGANMVLGVVDAGSPFAGQTAFAIYLDSGTGYVGVAQYLSLAHPNDNSSDEHVTLGNNLEAVLTVTDSDGDTDTDSVSVGNLIRFDDDGPKIDGVDTNEQFKLVHDETTGVQGEDDDVADALPAAFAGLATDANNDLHAAPDAPVNGPIGYAKSDVTAFANLNVNYGTDGQGAAPVYSFNLIGNGTSGVETGLFTTEGRKIELFQTDDNLIVGRFEPADNNNPDSNSSDEVVAFALWMDPASGIVHLVQYMSIQHGDTNSHDEIAWLPADLIELVVTVEDGDGDTDSESVPLPGNAIGFSDDGPSVAVSAPTPLFNGLFFDGFTLNNNAWGTGSGTVSGLSAGWTITDPTPASGSGNIELQRVGHNYLGMHSSTNGFMVDLNATSRNIAISQVLTGVANGGTYELTFEAGTPVAGSGKLEVYFGGELIDTIIPTGPGALTTYTYQLIGGFGNGSNRLEFREAGSEDNHGTYLANVTVSDILIIDETDGNDVGSDDTTLPGVIALFGGVTDVGIDPDMPDPEYATGTQAIVNYTANYGSDGPDAGTPPAYSLVINNANSGLTTTAGQAIVLFAQGDYIVGRYDAAGGTVDATDPAAFAIHIDPLTGIVSIAQYVSLHHDNALDHDEGAYLAAGTISAQVTVTDGDLDEASDDIDISGLIRFEDDGPSILPNNNQTVQRDWTLDEDVLPVTGNDALDNPADFNDYLTINDKPMGVEWGADGAKALTFIATDLNTPTIAARDEDGNPLAGPLKSGGVELHYVIVDNVDGGQTLTAYKGNGGPVVFTLTLDPDSTATGGFTFSLQNELDHPNADGQNRIDLDFGFIAKDGDNDTATSNIVIRIVDDVPYVLGAHDNLVTNGDFLAGTWSSPAWWGSVGQPGQVPGWSISGNISFPPQNGIQFERQAPGFLGLTSSTGNGLIDMGGSPGNYVLTQSVGAGAAPDLVAGKQYVLQVEVGAPFPTTALMEVYWNGQLIGTIDTNVDEGTMEKFAFIVEGTGNPATDVITFREVGTGTADLGNAPNGQDLQTEGYHGTYIANVQMYELNGVVDEDALNNPPAADGIGDSQQGDVSPDTTWVSGALGVQWGSDNSDVADVGNVQDGADGAELTGRNLTFTNADVAIFGTNVLKSNGDTVSFALLDNNTKLVGFVDSNGTLGYQAGDRLVFDVTLQDDGTGQFTFNLYDNLDHAPGASENDIALKFNFTAEDFDGDTANGSFFVGVDDDLPVASVVVNTVSEQGTATLIHDETAGVQSGGPDADKPADVKPEQDVAALPSVFVGQAILAGAGNGIGFAERANAVTITSQYGADGPGANTTLKLTDSTGAAFDGDATNLFDTATGQRIFLYTDEASGLVLGRIGNGTTLNSANAAGAIAFAIAIGDSGTLSLVQYQAIQHNDTGDRDEAVTLHVGGQNANILFVTPSTSDYDGDPVVGTPQALTIRFDDDGPSVFGVVINGEAGIELGDNLLQNPGFESGHGLGGSDWNIYQNIQGWTWGPDHVPFEIQTNTVGGLTPHNGNAYVELDGDTTGNPAHTPQGSPDPLHTNATIQQTVATVAGETYQIEFYYAPRPGDGNADSSSMNVLWNGQVVKAIVSDSTDENWQHYTLLVQATGTSATLGFQGAGQANEFGAFLDDISLKHVTGPVLDDEDTDSLNATEVQDGPGDDGADVTASGKILFDAGTDGLKSIVLGGIDGLLGIYVDAAGIGTAYSVAQVWNAGVDANGNPTGDIKSGTLVGTMTTPDGDKPVFTLEIDSDGNYTFKLVAPLSHPDQESPASFENNLLLDFGFTITDGDNDPVTGALKINVDDDSPEFAGEGVEDGTVTAFNMAITESLNLAFGADGEQATNGFTITGWPDMPGVTETLSQDGKTLTATIDGTNGADPDDVLYTLTLNGDGTYSFTLVNPLPGGVGELPTVGFGGGFGPTPSKDYAGFTLNGLNGGLLNGSNGVGINDANMDNNDQFQIVFDNEMTTAELGVNFAGNGTIKLHWIARDENGVQVGEGDTANFSADGSVTVDPGLSFFQLDLQVVVVDAPSQQAPKFKLISVGGETESSIPLESLTFQVTGTDGDGDAATDTFNIDVASVNSAPVITGGAVAGAVQESGDLLQIDEAGLGGGLKSTPALNATVTDALATLPGDESGVPGVLDTIGGQVGDRATAITIVWNYLDDNYVNNIQYNEAFVRLGIEYVEYLQAGGMPLIDVMAKFTPDSIGDGDLTPERLQSLHDNLLGNLNGDVLAGRFSGQLLTDLIALVTGVEPNLLTREWYSGNDHHAVQLASVRAWDIANGFVPAAIGQLTASDADFGETATLQWSGNANGQYGTFAIDPATGEWTYTLDDSDGDTQTLTEGQVEIEIFTVTVADVNGATDTVDVVITITGTNDAPVITGGVTTAVVFESGDLDNVVEAHEAADFKFEPGQNLDTFISAQLLVPGYDMEDVLVAVQGQLPATSGPADAIAAVWDHLDDPYVVGGPNQVNINEAFVRLGVEYAKYLEAGGRPLTDITVKFTPDGGDGGSAPDRVQSLHDNLLGNLSAAALTQRFAGDPSLHHALEDLIESVDPALLNRPYYAGEEGEANNALPYDIAHGFLPAASGQLTASDVDLGETATLVWSVEGTGAGTYGTFGISNTGAWTYTLNDSDGDTQALAEGQTETETFTVTVADVNGAIDTIDVTVTITGTNDAPVVLDQVNAITEDIAPDFVSGNLLAGATDVDSADLDIQGVSYNGGAVDSDGTIDGKYGSLIWDAETGAYTYTLNNSDPDTEALSDGDIVHDIFEFVVTDGTATDSNTLDVTINGHTDALPAPLAPVGASAIYAYGDESNEPAGQPTQISLDLASLFSGQGDPANMNYTFETVAAGNNTTGGTLGSGQWDWLSRTDNMISGNPPSTGRVGLYTAKVTATNVVTGESTYMYVALTVLASGATYNLLTSDGDSVTGTTWNGNVVELQDGVNIASTVNPNGPVDVLIGNDFANSLQGAHAEDALYGGAGHDTLNGQSQRDFIAGGSGDDTIYGEDGADILLGEEGNDTLWGGSQNDILIGGVDSDKLYGESDADYLDGGDGNDELYGGSNNDMLIGGAGADLLDGGTDADTLWGGFGIDDMTGGSNNDIFFYNSSDELSATVADIIRDLDAPSMGNDEIQIDASNFGLAGSGLLSEVANTGLFAAGANDAARLAATDSVRFFYQQDTHTLWYDGASGSGQQWLQLAQVENSDVAANDIRLV